MAAGLQLESSGVTDLRQKFYELLLEFSTFPAAQNFFLVQIHELPGYVVEANVDKLGIRPGTGWSTGLNLAKKQVFEPFFGGGNNWMFLATGINLTTETTSVNNKGTLINGLLPVGPFMESREFPDNDLDIQFSETNVSILDSIFRSWIQLYSVYGNMGDVTLTTDVSIYFISKQNDNPYDGTPLINKIYTYKDCIPYQIKDANVAEYDGDTKLGSVAVGWRFSKYDVRIPVRGANLAKGIMEDFMPVPTEHEIPYLGGRLEDIPDPGLKQGTGPIVPQKRINDTDSDKSAAAALASKADDSFDKFFQKAIDESNEDLTLAEKEHVPIKGLQDPKHWDENMSAEERETIGYEPKPTGPYVPPKKDEIKEFDKFKIGSIVDPNQGFKRATENKDTPVTPPPPPLLQMPRKQEQELKTKDQPKTSTFGPGSPVIGGPNTGPVPQDQENRIQQALQDQQLLNLLINQEGPTPPYEGAEPADKPIKIIPPGQPLPPGG